MFMPEITKRCVEEEILIGMVKDWAKYNGYELIISREIIDDTIKFRIQNGQEGCNVTVDCPNKNSNTYYLFKHITSTTENIFSKDGARKPKYNYTTGVRPNALRDIEVEALRDRIKHLEKDLESTKRKNVEIIKENKMLSSAFRNACDKLANADTPLKIKNVIFSNPATIVFWADGTKTVVKCGEMDIYDAEKGLAMAISRKALGNNYDYYKPFKKWLPKWYERSSESKRSVEIGKAMECGCASCAYETTDLNENPCCICDIYHSNWKSK